jgi:tryptophan 7-halogenase
MSAGFLEPLEASALVLIELAGKMISEELPANRGVMDVVAQRYNEKFLYRWDRIIDFLKLHYVLSRRQDSDYWRDNRSPASIPTACRNCSRCGRTMCPGTPISPSAMRYSHPRVTSTCSTAWASRRRREPARATPPMPRGRGSFSTENRQQADKLVRNLPLNRDLLAHISEHGLPRA